MLCISNRCQRRRRRTDLAALELPCDDDEELFTFGCFGFLARFFVELRFFERDDTFF